MNEGEPKFEPNQEQKLAEDLKYKGIDDPEVKKELADFVMNEEKKAFGAEGSARLLIRLGKIYFEGGYHQEAFENLEEALYAAQRAELYELHTEISQLLYEYEDRLKNRP